jgi:hypothetical protein
MTLNEYRELHKDFFRKQEELENKDWADQCFEAFLGGLILIILGCILYHFL